MADRNLVRVQVLDEHVELGLTEVCHVCETRLETVVEMVREGIVAPVDTSGQEWRFTGASVTRIRTTLRLQRDLDVNLAGAALALDLLEEIASLRRRLGR